MGGNSVYNTSNSCYICAEEGHWARDCKYGHVPCILGFPFEMKLRKSTQPHSYGCRFMNCKGQLKGCNAFMWIDHPNTSMLKGQTSATRSSANTSQKNIKVTVEENGKKITYEGEVDAIMELMNSNLKM